jgi:hypothetical protein
MAVGPTDPSSKCVLFFSFLGVKWLECEAKYRHLVLRVRMIR